MVSQLQRRAGTGLGRTLDVARDEQRKGVDDAGVLVHLGTVVAVAVDDVVAPELGRRAVHVEQHHAVAVGIGLGRAAEIVDLARGHAVGVLLRRLAMAPPRRVADEEDLEHREAVDAVQLRTDVLRQALHQLEQRQARQRQHQALGAQRDRAVLRRDIERQRRLAELQRCEAQQPVAAGERHVRVALQPGQQAFGQPGRAALDAGELLADGLERAQPPDDPLGRVQVLRDHVIEGPGVAQLHQRAVAEHALRRQRVPEAHVPQRLTVQLGVLAQPHVVGLGQRVDPGLVVGLPAHDEHDAALQQLQRVQAALRLGQVGVVGGELVGRRAGEVHQAHAQLGAQRREARLQRRLEAHRAVLGDEAVHVLGLDASAPAVGGGFQHQNLAACIGQAQRAVQARHAAASDDDVMRGHGGSLSVQPGRQAYPQARGPRAAAPTRPGAQAAVTWAPGRPGRPWRRRRPGPRCRRTRRWRR
mmetsp:Transcript_38721/g.90688  ORF Transcript_38721/g.90688 Transcript_38721/m.90688 type:complete len:473 (+) Transcript_38721:525-1943(+)